MHQAQWATVCGLLGLFAGFFGGGALIAHVKPRASPLTLTAADLSGTAIFIAPALLVLHGLVWLAGIPYLDQVLESCWIFVFLLLTAGWVGRKLPSDARMVYLAVLLPVMLFSGLVAGGITPFVLTVLMIGLTIRGPAPGRVPWFAVLVAIGASVLLQPAKSEYRRVVWKGNEPPDRIERLALFFKLGWRQFTEGGGTRRPGGSRINAVEENRPEGQPSPCDRGDHP